MAWPARASLPSPCSRLRPSGFSVPSELRPARDEEGLPPFPRNEPAERGQEGAVDRSVPDSSIELALEDTHLVTEDDVFDILVEVPALRREHEREHTAETEVDERGGHRR